MDNKVLSEKINNLDAKGLQELLKEVKLYQDLKRKLGNRWEDLFERKHSKEKLLVVEHFTSVSEDLAWEQAQVVYQKAFTTIVQREKVQFMIKDWLKWGIKVYLDDSMVDLSFAKIAKTIKN